ncbi:MAG: amidase family protein [Gammaproteobacteria bacterium]|jgi:Asp-tRNA(Asn)/Glu-tRNA(Gln) amidotransferase A subunit family amidase|nr:amidase family protein [Gammaproteobacteria bacterium]
MLSLDDYLALDAVALGAGIAKGDFSALEVNRCAVDRAQAINPALNAIVHEDFAGALKRAESNTTKASPLAGVPFLIKDLSPVAGLPVNFGSALFKDHIAQANSKIVQRYADAGLNFLGKTNTPEWGLTLTTEPQQGGACRNPWHTDFSTGGSSGGAAAAVAAGIVPAAHASDGGGSIRIPAANCGLFGLKPSRGLTAIEGTLAECWSGFSVGHVVSQTVRDSAAFLDLITLSEHGLFANPVLGGPAAAHFTQALATEAPSALRIALVTTHPTGETIDPEVLEGMRIAGALLANLGHHVDERPHPVDHATAGAAMSKIIGTHVLQSIKPRLDSLGLSLDDAPVELSTKVMAKGGAKVSASDYVAARDCLRAAELQMSDFHHQFDVIVSPVLSKPPAPLGWLDMNASDMQNYAKKFREYSGFTAFYNGTGAPSMSVPLHRTASGLPIGIMMSADWGQDALLLRLAAQIEQAAPWQRRAPI